MKKFKLITKMIIIAFILIITGCQQKPIEVYDIYLGAATEGIFLSDKVPLREVQNIQSYNKESAEKEIPYSFNGKEIMLTYQKTNYCDLWGSERDEYRYNDILNYIVDKKNSVYAISSNKDFNIMECDRELEGESEYRKWVEEYIKNNIQHIDISGYIYSCSTHTTEEGKDSLANNTYNEFYTSPKENETIRGYGFLYVKVHNGYATTDQIFIRTDISGNINMILQFSKNLDWSACPEIDEEKVDLSVKEFLKNNINTKDYNIVDYRIKDKTLCIIDSSYELALGVEIELSGRSNITTLQKLYITLG